MLGKCRAADPGGPRQRDARTVRADSPKPLSVAHTSLVLRSHAPLQRRSAEAELAFRGQAETWRAEFERQEAERQAQAAADAAEASCIRPSLPHPAPGRCSDTYPARATVQATLFGEPFPWLGSWSDKLYWALRTFGLSAQGVRHKAGKRTGGGKDIWWNEDGSLDFVDSDDIVRS